MSFRTKLKAALEAGSRNDAIQALLAHPNATVAELRKLSQTNSNLAKQFKAITIATCSRETASGRAGSAPNQREVVRQSGPA